MRARFTVLMILLALSLTIRTSHPFTTVLPIMKYKTIDEVCALARPNAFL